MESNVQKENNVRCAHDFVQSGRILTCRNCGHVDLLPMNRSMCAEKGEGELKEYEFKVEKVRGGYIAEYKGMRYRVQVICNRCRSRVKPIITKGIKNPNPYISKWWNCYGDVIPRCKEQTELFAPFVKEAADAWNSRGKDA